MEWSELTQETGSQRKRRRSREAKQRHARAVRRSTGVILPEEGEKENQPPVPISKKAATPQKRKEPSQTTNARNKRNKRVSESPKPAQIRKAAEAVQKRKKRASATSDLKKKRKEADASWQ